MFYANNLTDLVVRTAGEGRVVEKNKFTSDADTIASADARRDRGDGKGVAWRETDPNIVLSGSGVRAVRRLYRFGADDWNVKPFSYLPTNYTGGFDSVPGMPGYRYNLKGEPRKYAETEIDETLVNKPFAGQKAPWASYYNPDKKPVARHVYIQSAMRVSRDWLWHRPSYWTTAEQESRFGMNGTNSLHSNKFIFYTGGQSNDQVAMISGNKTGALGVLFYDGASGTNNWSKERTHAGGKSSFLHSAIDLGGPATSASTPGEQMLGRYGPSLEIMALGKGLSAPMGPLPPGITVPTTALNPQEYLALGIDPYEGSKMSAPWRGYPYGGYSDTKNQVFPDLNLPDAAWSGIMRPDEWLVVEVLISDQVDRPANDDKTIQAVAGQQGSPRFVAMWAAPYGKPPVLLAYTNTGDQAGPAMIPSRWNDDQNPIFKFQDANVDDYAEVGALIVGPASNAGCMAPTTTQFDVIYFPDARARTTSTPYGATSQKYYKAARNSHFNPGTRPDWGGGYTFGFSRGVMTGAAYEPVHPTLGTKIHPDDWGVYQQFEIEKTEYLGFSVPEPKSGALVPVHRVTVSSPMPIAPSVSDTIVVNQQLAKYQGKVKTNAPFTESSMYYGEVIFSVDPVPFPGHHAAPLPMPWRN